jgi:hypothetical protein
LGGVRCSECAKLNPIDPPTPTIEQRQIGSQLMQSDSRPYSRLSHTPSMGHDVARSAKRGCQLAFLERDWRQPEVDLAVKTIGF